MNSTGLEFDLEPPRCEEDPVELKLEALAGMYMKLHSGYDISRQAITRAKKEGRYNEVEGLGYGEVDVEAFGSFMRSLPVTRQHGTFVDMGSGSGKAVLAAGFTGRFSRCVGVEIMRPLHNLALQAQERASALNPESTCVVHFELGDIFAKEDYWRAADVLLVTCTLFTDEMMHKLETAVTEFVRPGTIVITTTRTIHTPRARCVTEGRIKYAKGSLLFIVYVVQ